MSAPRCRRRRTSARRSLCRPAGRFACGPEVVRSLQRREASRSDPHRARTELRSSRRRGARRAGARESRHHSLESISASRAPAATCEFTRLSRDGSASPASLVCADQNRNWGQASLNLLSFEVDIWGRLRRATEAARANLLERRRESQSRGHHPGERRRHGLFQSAAARL